MAVTVTVKEPMEAVALADITKTVPDVMERTVAPVGTPAPNTMEPGRMPEVLETVTFGLPLDMDAPVNRVDVPTVSMDEIAVTPVRGAVRPSRRVKNKSTLRLCPSAGAGKGRRRVCQKVTLTILSVAGIEPALAIWMPTPLSRLGLACAAITPNTHLS